MIHKTINTLLNSKYIINKISNIERILLTENLFCGTVNNVLLQPKCIRLIVFFY